MLLLSVTLHAQDGDSQVTYSNLALQFSTNNLNGDAETGYFPSVANANGYGSFIDNPASTALMGEGFFNFSFINNKYDYENSYLNNTLGDSEASNKFGHLGFVYKMPTEQGAFVIGGGYNRINSHDGLNRLSARNSESTLTDDFKDPSSDYYDIAYESYAIDWGDVDSTYLESIFRIGIDYPGISQDAEITYRTDLGEYTVFFGTEFQKDLYLGISAGIISGTYSYRRNFLEDDDQNDYNSDFIDGTDIDQIITYDEIDADITGLALRAGLIYKISPSLNIGLSYLLPSQMRVQENYYSSIETIFDDGLTTTPIGFEGDFEYRINKPGQLNIGFAAEDINNFTFSASAEYVDYSNIELDFITDSDLDFNEEVTLRQQQEELNNEISQSYNKVVNVKTAAGYSFSEQFELKAGYTYLPGRSSNFEANRNVFSGGLEAALSSNIKLNLNTQYSFWKDRSLIYNYFDDVSGDSRTEYIDEKVSKLSIVAGIKFLF